MQEPNLDPVMLIDLTKEEEESDLLSKFNTLQSHYDYLRTMLEIQGERSIQPYTWQINFDSVYFAVVPFWMPTKTIKINSCKLKIVGSNYRGYSGDVTVGGSGATGVPSPTSTGSPSITSTGSGGTGSTSSAGSHVHDCPTTGSNGSHAHSQESSYSESSHYHSISIYTSYAVPNDPHRHTVSGNTGSGSSHSHSQKVTSSTGSHTHSVGNTTSAGSHTHTGPSHTHSMQSHTHSLSSHTHGIGTHDHGFTLAIIEGTDPTGVNVYIDNGSGYGSSIKNANSPVNIEMDIKEYISITQGWKKVKVTSTRLGRADITLILDVQINRVD